MWILPEMNLFANNPIIKRYRSRTPVNSPELYNINSFLKKYLHKAVDCHVRFKNSLYKLYPEKFIIETPKKGT